VAELDVDEGLSPGQIEEAVAALWRRHDALRIRFAPDARDWKFEVTAESAQWTQMDLSGLPAGLEGRALATVAGQVRALDPLRGPVARVVLIEREGGQPSRLVVAAHPLAVDRTSMGVLLEDLEAACGQRHRGEPAVLSRGASFRQWAVRLAEREVMPRLQAKTGFGAKSARRRGELPVRGEAVEEKEPKLVLLTLLLSAEETRSLLEDVPRAYGTAVEDALLSALAQAFFKWTGEPLLLVDVWRPMRQRGGEGLDSARLVGCLDETVPALLHLGAAQGPGEALKTIKEQLRQPPSHATGSAEVSFRGPGFVSLIGRPRLLAAVDEPAWGEAGRHRIAVDCDLAGDRLRFSWLSRGGDSISTLERLAESCRKALGDLITHCLDPQTGGYTPSDFPRVEVGQRELDDLVASRPGADRRKLEDIYPLTPLQQGMLFHILENPDSGIYLNQQCFTLQGELEEETLRAAFERVVARHPALRTTVGVSSRGEPFQVVWRHGPLPWRYLDWRSLPSDRLEKELAALHRAEGERGFEISREPLIRPILIRIGDDTYQFIWSFHLILLDGWSTPLIFGEVLAFYDAFRQGCEPELAPPAPYSRYIDWMQRQDRTEAEGYWRRTFAGFDAQVFGEGEMPWEAPGKEADYGARELRLAPAEIARLRAFARESQLTLNTLVQGAWALHLSQSEGTEDVIFGSVVSGRPVDLPDVESTVGLFLNTLPVRVRVVSERPLLSWLAGLQEQQAEARRYEFSALVDIQKWSGLSGRRALFDTVVIFQNIPLDPSLSDPKRNLRVLGISSKERNNYPLTLVVTPDAGLVLRMVYDRRHFQEIAVARMLEKIHRLLLEMASRPEGSLASLSPSSAVERQQLVNGFNQALE
jgi:non-ribosomal peptide synthetase component F